MSAPGAVCASPIFARLGTECTQLPENIASRPGWREWADGHDVRLWHHATDVTEPFSIFCRQDEASIGFHFGTHAAAIERHRIMFRMGPPEERHEEGFMLTVVVRYRNALRMMDKHCWGMDSVTGDLVSRGILDPDREDEILSSCDTQALFAAVEDAGYDAILYANETEGVHDGGRDSLLVWRAAQIRSIHALAFTQEDPRLCPSLQTGIKEWQWWTENERGLNRWLRHFRKEERQDLCLPA